MDGTHPHLHRQDGCEATRYETEEKLRGWIYGHAPTDRLGSSRAAVRATL